MHCHETLTIETGGRPVTIKVTDTSTIVTITHKRSLFRLPLITWLFGPIQEQDLGPVTFSHSQGATMQNLSDSQQVSGVVSVLDKKGNPAAIEAGSSKFVSSDETIVTVEPDPANELGATVKAQKPGSATVTWTADADLGEGVTSISASEDFTVTAGQAVGGTIAFGIPSEQP